MRGRWGSVRVTGVHARGEVIELTHPFVDDFFIIHETRMGLADGGDPLAWGRAQIEMVGRCSVVAMHLNVAATGYSGVGWFDLGGGERFGSVHDLFFVELSDVFVGEPEHGRQYLGGVLADGGCPSPDLSRG